MVLEIVILVSASMVSWSIYRLGCRTGEKCIQEIKSEVAKKITDENKPEAAKTVGKPYGTPTDLIIDPALFKARKINFGDKK